MSKKIKTPKKLIEVALPLDDINAAAAREKSIRHGHPSTLHLWWARRPLAAARAVIFAQMVNDPGYQQGEGFKYGVNKREAEIKREKLFAIIRDLVKWENSNNEEVLNRAREAIKQSWRETCELNKNHPQADELFNPDKLPAFHDPFAGGGAIPLEAQRLGLESYASDLNPVAVMINKAMIEIPPRFAGQAPVGSPSPPSPALPPLGGGSLLDAWPGATGLAEDVRRYGHWMREEAWKRIGHLYPKIRITKDMAKDRPDLKGYIGQDLTVIAWLWARTVKSPNPAFSQVDVPLVRSFVLSSKKGKEAWVEPVIENNNYRFEVRIGKKPKDAIDGTVVRTGGTCILSQTAMPFSYIRAEGKAGRMGERLMAIVAEGKKGRVYLSPTQEMLDIARSAQPEWKPEHALPVNPRDFKTPNYGMDSFGDLFTPRQLVALTTFSDLVAEARNKAIQDAKAARKSPSPQRGEVGRGEDKTGKGEKHWHPTPIPSQLLAAARALRKNMTDAEQRLWQCLRKKQVGGFRFRKQHPIGHFVLDFYCPERKLAIELDGGQHNQSAAIDKDRQRTEWLAQQGIQVLRFWNNEVFENLEGVLQRVWEVLHGAEGAALPPPGLPPLGGGDAGSLGKEEIDPGDVPLCQGGTGATAYGDALAVYLGFAVDRASDSWSSISSWTSQRDTIRNTFSRQALPMVWDFAEVNPFSDSTGHFGSGINWINKVIELMPATNSGGAVQGDAATQSISIDKVISTDPPYYDNIGYADLSDFFYVWMRRSLRSIYPALFTTMAVPKAEELVATPYRHGSKEKAETFFLDGMTQAIHNMAEKGHPAFPVTIYYAFKQSETKDGSTSNTGWETFLDAVIRAGFSIDGTWPCVPKWPIA